jgi:hypothetical protein
MNRLLVLALAAASLGGCTLGPEGAAEVQVLVKDDAAPLTGGRETLFEIHYCANGGGQSYLVSELRVEMEAQGLHWHSGYDLRYALTTDLDRDHRFGPGDVLTVSEKDWDSFDASDIGMTYKVSLFQVPDLGMDELLSEADWQAR